jgi:phosphate:Na+ symporter
VTKLLSGNIPHSVALEARRQIRIADEFESISDYIVNLDKFDRKLRRDGHRFSPQQRAGLHDLNEHVSDYLSAVNQALLHDNDNVLTKTDGTSRRVRDEIRMLRRQLLDDLSGGEIPPLVSVAFLATLNAYARVRDHTQNIAEVISGEK